MGLSVTALRLPPSVHDRAAFVTGDIAAMPSLGTVEQVRTAVNAAFRRRGLSGAESPSTGLFVPEDVTDISLGTDDGGQVRFIIVSRPDGPVIDVLAGLGLHVLDSGAFDIIAEPAASLGVDAAVSAAASQSLTYSAPPAYSAPTQYGAPPAYEQTPAPGQPVASYGAHASFGPPAGYAPGMPTASVRPVAGSITAALIIETVAAALTILLIVVITMSAIAAGNQPPSNFLLAMFIVSVTVVLRAACMVLVRGGYGWARWVYLAVVVIGTGAMAGFPSLPIVNLLLILAVVTTVLVFRRSAREWLKWRAAQRTQAA
ncbi:hypothetical protein QFZ53_001707 [Microbacterium natoriense]|uniref:Uncharacterized protein n=1 Tax=Microbacterium natoriense TaxID=284570 RepID=A0AAW8EW10_9MICO|nr:hypothetical protein [Microbacterium natoriense]MDQ0647511.1 hypothetical protein [Microbacterium natoriense]